MLMKKLITLCSYFCCKDSTFFTRLQVNGSFLHPLVATRHPSCDKTPSNLHFLSDGDKVPVPDTPLTNKTEDVRGKM